MDWVTITAIATAALAAFLLTALLGRIVIPLLHKLKFGQTIRGVGPAWHQKKQGTPTMGGLLFIGVTVLVFALVVVIDSLFAAKILNSAMMPGLNGVTTKILGATPLALTKLFGGLLMALCCGALGFADDYIKVIMKRNLGLTARQKLFGQLIVALGYALSIYMAKGASVGVPFIGDVDFGLLFIPFCMFVVVSMTNAVNLTDGVDGLCGTISFVVSLFFIVAAGVTRYFGLSLFASILAGALAGFLVWNLHPAKVFMGDTGSLFIGGAITALAFGINQPFLLIPVGIIYIAETLSVLMQVTYFKLTHGKRLFKMSPLHHHFEMSGWSENKIVIVFSAITMIGCVAAWSLLMYA